MHALITVHNITPPSVGERIRVQAAQALGPEEQGNLKREIAALVSFTQGMSLTPDAVSFLELHEEAEELFRSLSPMVVSRPARVQVIVTAFNHGVEGETRIVDSTLRSFLVPCVISLARTL
jgi:hypothetical protein